MPLPFLPSEQRSIFPNQLKVSPLSQCRRTAGDTEIEKDIKLRWKKNTAMCIPMQENVMGSKNHINTGIKAAKRWWNVKTVTLRWTVMSVFIFAPLKLDLQVSFLVWVVGYETLRCRTVSKNLPTGRLIFPVPSFLVSGGPAGAGRCCDITIGGRGPYHPSKLKCPLDAFNILLIKIAECSTTIHSHYSGRGSLWSVKWHWLPYDVPSIIGFRRFALLLLFPPVVEIHSSLLNM